MLIFYLMVKKRFLYEIVGLQPAGGDRLGRFGFSVFLDREIAKKAFEKELPEGHHFNEIAESILIDCGLIKKSQRIYHSPYNFAKNEEGNLSSLIHYVQVPGDACELGMAWREIDSLRRDDHRNWVEYHPDNVDNHQQAYALLGLFTYWANIINILFKDKPIPGWP